MTQLSFTPIIEERHCSCLRVPFVKSIAPSSCSKSFPKMFPRILSDITDRKIIFIFIAFLCTLIFSALNIVAEDIQISLAPLPDPFMGREPYYLTLKDDNNSLSRVLSNGMISTKGLAPIYFSVVVTNNSNREIEFPYPFKSASGYNMLSFEVIKEDKAKLLIKKKWQVHAPLDNKEIDKLGWGTIPPKSSIVIPVVFSDIIWDNINELNKLKYDKNNAMIIALIKVEGFCNLRSEPVKISWVLLDDWYNGIKPLTNEIGQPHELPK